RRTEADCGPAVGPSWPLGPPWPPAGPAASLRRPQCPHLLARPPVQPPHPLPARHPRGRGVASRRARPDFDFASWRPPRPETPPAGDSLAVGRGRDCRGARGGQWPFGGRVSGARGGRAGGTAPMRPLQRLICFCRYLRWFTFRFDLPGLSSASLMLLDAESMKLSRSRVASRTSPPSAPDSSAPAGAPVSSSSKQQPLSRAPKAPPSPSGEPPEAEGHERVRAEERRLHRHRRGSPAVR
uniref:Uncharacterized protein n=1 Tax=Macaca fascicularis TaxID=9541 RepID=A0A7N9CB24_MACFA